MAGQACWGCFGRDGPERGRTQGSAAPHALCAAPTLQVLGLEELGVHAAALTSLTGKEEAAAISRQASRPLGAVPTLRTAVQQWVWVTLRMQTAPRVT